VLLEFKEKFYIHHQVSIGKLKVLFATIQRIKKIYFYIIPLSSIPTM